MARAKEITAGVFQVGGDGVSRGEDCCVYLVDGGTESASIDTGASNPLIIVGVSVVRFKYCGLIGRKYVYNTVCL